MLDVTQDIQPLTTFRNNSVKMMKRMKKTGRPIISTVNGKAEATVLSAVAYQRLLDIAAAANEREGVRQGDPTSPLTAPAPPPKSSSRYASNMAYSCRVLTPRRARPRPDLRHHPRRRLASGRPLV